jgi:class 3 adenylate cyclase/tetratricopeptide (TPR) repeat protein
VIAAPPDTSPSLRLRPYVPKLAIEWLREQPQTRYRQVEGSLAFVDISGFTNLTERLSRKGKVGAEEMNQILNSCFTEFLSSAYDYGAGVIKWGGDAVLLLFEGAEHEARAARAAFEMQRTMRRVGRIKTGSGTVTLRMSIGVHSGAFDFFLVGDLHRELVITGPAATQTVAMEGAAEAGEIALSPATAAALDPRDLGEPKGPAILLRRGPKVVGEREGWVEGVEELDLAACVPVAVREHLVAGGGEPEHRPLTAAFIHFMGVDELLASEGPEALAAALDTTISTVERIALDHGVAFFDTDIYQSGGKVMLMGGAPASTGADEERMLRAMRAVMNAELPLQLRIGVNRGRIFVGDFGPDYRRTYTVTGDAVNLAARLMAKAEPGEILATDDVLTRSRTAFQTVPLEPFQAKGKTEPVYAFLVGGTQTREERMAATPLVGREQELEVLLDAFASASAYSGRLVEVVAEPGMGKSRLIEELRVRSTPVHAFSTQCDEYEASTPYHAFRGLLRGLLELEGEVVEGDARALRARVEASAPHLLPLLPLLGVPLGIELPDTPETKLLEDQFRKARLEEAVRELLGILLLQPTLMIFEDTHWMDEASADLLRALLVGLEERPWLLVVTRRDQATGFGAPEGSGAVLLELDPLSEEQAAELVHAATEEAPLAPHEIAVLAERAGGNPLFLTELLAAARAPGGLQELPESVEALMLAEIDRLPPADRRVLRCAAVVGATFTEELVGASLDEPPDPGIWRRLAEYVDEQPDGQLRFRHALVRDAAYEGLPYRRRRELHERVGLTLESAADRPEDEAELLSLHFFQAHDFERAWRYSRVAGGHAQAIYANVEAATFFERALASAKRISTSPHELRSVQEGLGDVTFRLGEFTRAVSAYRASRRGQELDPVEEARLLLKEAMVPFRLGRYTAVVRWLNRAVRTLDGLHQPSAAAERARIAVWYATTRQRQHRPEEAIEWCRRAIADAESTHDARDALAQAYDLLDRAYLALGRPDEAVFAPRALAIYEELGRLEWVGSVLNNMGIRAYMEGRWSETLDFISRARNAWEATGDRWWASFATINIADILLDQGRIDEAEPLAREAFRIWKAAQTPVDVADATMLLGRIAARSDRFEDAIQLLEEARDLYAQAGESGEAFVAEARMVECRVLQGDASAALEQGDRTLGRLVVSDDTVVVRCMLHRLRGCALLQHGAADDARAALEESLRIARSSGSNFGTKNPDYEIALSLDVLALSMDDSEVRELREERDAIFARLGVVAPPELPSVGVSGEASRL